MYLQWDTDFSDLTGKLNLIGKKGVTKIGGKNLIEANSRETTFGSKNQEFRKKRDFSADLSGVSLSVRQFRKLFKLKSVSNGHCMPRVPWNTDTPG